jgi:hypothetical protein
VPRYPSFDYKITRVTFRPIVFPALSRELAYSLAQLGIVAPELLLAPQLLQQTSDAAASFAQAKLPFGRNATAFVIGWIPDQVRNDESIRQAAGIR